MGMAFVAALGISGCGVTNLNEEQNAQAAEYIAGIMLKYTAGYEKSLIYPVVTTEPVSPEETQTPSQTPEAEEPEKPAKSSKPTGGSQETDVSSDISNVMKLDGCKIEYKGMTECSSYKETENASYGIFAEDEKKLVVVKFQIKNISSKDVKLNLHKKDITYQLILSNGNTVTSQLTLLDNDLNYLSQTVKKGGKVEGVVIFTVNKKADVKDVKLKAIGSNTTAEITL